MYSTAILHHRPAGRPVVRGPTRSHNIRRHPCRNLGGKQRYRTAPRLRLTGDGFHQNAGTFRLGHWASQVHSPTARGGVRTMFGGAHHPSDKRYRLGLFPHRSQYPSATDPTSAGPLAENRCGVLARRNAGICEPMAPRSL